ATARAERIDVAPVGFGLRMNQRVAVYLRGRSQQEAGSFVLGQPQGLVRAERTDLERLDRKLQIVHGAGRRGEVPHVVDRPLQETELGDLLLDEPKARITGQVVDVGY